MELTVHLSVYQHTFVRSIEDSKIITNQGTVTAKHIVMATHYPLYQYTRYYFLRMHQERSYVLALENAADLHGYIMVLTKMVIPSVISSPCFFLAVPVIDPEELRAANTDS